MRPHLGAEPEGEAAPGQVLEATGREDSSAKEVVSLIAADQSLTAKILQLVHRADMGVRGEVNSIDRADVVTLTIEQLGIVVPVHEFHRGHDIAALVRVMRRHA